MQNIIKTSVFFMVGSVFFSMCISTVSWLSAYALSCIEHNERAQQAAFGYYQDILSVYTQHSIPAALLLSFVASTWWTIRAKR